MNALDKLNSLLSLVIVVLGPDMVVVRYLKE